MGNKDLKKRKGTKRARKNKCLHMLEAKRKRQCIAENDGMDTGTTAATIRITEENIRQSSGTVEIVQPSTDGTDDDSSRSTRTLHVTEENIRQSSGTVEIVQPSTDGTDDDSSRSTRTLHVLQPVQFVQKEVFDSAQLIEQEVDLPINAAMPALIADEVGETRKVKDGLSESMNSATPALRTGNVGEDGLSESESIDLEYSSEVPNEIKPKDVGRRIIDVGEFSKKLLEIASHGPIGCTSNDIVLVGEKQNGLRSTFTYLCKMCNLKFTIDSDFCLDDYVDVNTCAIAGCIATGCGHAQLEEFLAALNLPPLSKDIYRKGHDLLTKQWEKVTNEAMANAAKEERDIAIAEGRVHKSGLPIIDVIADACYSKRSYKKNYSALSGAGTIIGARTKKILYLGIKNKYCYACSRASEKNETSKPHACFKNYDGPSTGMESLIIVEGFKESVDTHGLIYGRLISDGDASTYSKILEARPYPDVTVEKIECRNHVLRNFCNKLQALQTDTKYDRRHRKLIVKKRIMAMRSVVTKSIQRHKEGSDVQSLFADIHCSHKHAFGNHTSCKQYFCEKKGEVEQIEPTDFFAGSLWIRICFIVNSVAEHSRSLIHDVDSNVVEGFHSVIAKFVGGKRINFSLKNSYATRCRAAATAFNGGKSSISRVFKAITAKSPGGKLKRLENIRERTRTWNKSHKRLKRRIIFKRHGQDKNYGENCTKPDMAPEIYEKTKNEFLESLRKSEAERKAIERNTILQSGSSEWLELRRCLLTASNFGKVIKRRPETSCKNLVKQLLYKTNINSVPSIKHGIQNEKIAIKQLEGQEGIQVKPCGLFIDDNIPFLGASPDGLCGDDTIIEIKCPITANKSGIEDAITKKKITFWKKSGEINTSHIWYFQIQGQLHVTKKPKCLFAVWGNENENLKTATVYKDDEFWKKNMEEKLVKFYMDCILPELIDPRHPRGMPIKDPQYIEEAAKKKTLTKNK